MQLFNGHVHLNVQLRGNKTNNPAERYPTTLTGRENQPNQTHTVSYERKKLRMRKSPVAIGNEERESGSGPRGRVRPRARSAGLSEIVTPSGGKVQPRFLMFSSAKGNVHPPTRNRSQIETLNIQRHPVRFTQV